jgi:hypothetical protein
MPAGFDAEGKELVRSLPREAEPFTRDFRANEKFYLFFGILGWSRIGRTANASGSHI